MEKMREMEVPGKEIPKLLTLWPQIGPSTEYFRLWMNHVSGSDVPFRIVLSDDFFFIREDEIPFPQLHGFFSDWEKVRAVCTLLRKKYTILTKSPPASGDKFKIDPYVYYQYPGGTPTPVDSSVGSISDDEIHQLMRSQSPELYENFFLALVKNSLQDKLFTVIRNEKNEVVFFHVVRKLNGNLDGVYLWSALSFGETVKEYTRSVQRMGNAPLSSIVLSSHRESIAFHEFMGFKKVKVHNYLVTYNPEYQSYPRSAQ